MLPPRGQHRSSYRLAVVAGILAVFAVAPAWALHPHLGPVFRVNARVVGLQTHPLVLAHPDGHYVVLWSDDVEDDIVARLVTRDGGFLSGELAINTTTAGDQRDASAAIAPSGELVVVWTSIDGDDARVVGRRFSAVGQPLTGEFLIAEDVFSPSVGTNAEGNAIVSFRVSDVFGNTTAVAKEFDADGAQVGEAIPVSPVVGFDATPALATLPAGEFVVAWHNASYDLPEPPYGLYERNSAVVVRRVNEDGGAHDSTEIAGGGNEKYRPRVAAGNAGFVVAWSGCYSDPGEYQARPCDYHHVGAQAFGADGAARTPSFRASGSPGGYTRMGPGDAAMHDSGRFTVVWNGPTVADEPGGIVARQFATTGPDSPLDPQPPFSSSVLIESDPSLGYGEVRVAAGPGDDVMVVWERDTDIYAAHVSALEICTDRTCNSPREGEGRLKLRSQTAERPKLVRWVWYGRGTARTCLADEGTSASATLDLRISDSADFENRLFIDLVLDAPVCGSPPCWSFPKRHVVLYEDPAASQSGIDLVRYRVGRLGRSKLVVRATGPKVPEFELPVQPPVFVLSLGKPGNAALFFPGACHVASFFDALMNDSQVFRAVGASAPESS